MVWSTNKQCPFKYKYELVEWAHNKWPDKSEAYFNKMTKSKLYAIFYNTRDKPKRRKMAW